MNKTFLEILGDQILKQTQQKSSAFHSENVVPTDNEPTCITQLLGRHHLDKSTPSSLPNFNKVQSTGYRLYIKENPPRKHRLDTDQWIIWNQWRKWGLSLTESFTRKDLKKAYRLLALRHHPDRATGSAAEFQQIKKDYDRLLQVFTAKA
jgi:hypothetical protein